MGHGNPGGRYILKSRTREEKLAVPVCNGSDPPLICTGVFSLISARGVAICKLHICFRGISTTQVLLS